MKSRMFGSRSDRTRRDKFGGSAGNSASNNKPSGRDGYKEGRLGYRASPMGGGQRIADKLSERPAAVEHSLRGAGGIAWDRSMDAAFDNEPAPAHWRKMS